MKKEALFLTLLFLLMCIIGYCVYPGHITSQEADSLFLLTSDYIQDHLLRPAGLMELFMNFLYQFYRWVIAGVLIQSLFPVLVALASLSLLKKLKLVQYSWIAFIPTVLLWINQYTWTSVATMQYCIFTFILAGYLSIKISWIRYGLAFFIIPILYSLIPGSCMILLYLYLACYEWFLFADKNKIVFPLINLSGTYLWPLLWNHLFYFYSIDQAYAFVIPSITDIDIVYYFIYLLPACYLLLVKIKGKAIKTITWAFPVTFIIAGGYIVYISPENRISEKGFRFSQYTENENWDKLLNEITPQETENAKYQRYIALALSEKGLLAKQLFSYPIQTAENFTFPADDLSGASFNSLFYHHLGLNNEAIHQIFQAGSASKKGISFSLLRRLTDLQIENRNMPIINKYIYLLSRSTCHGGWVKTRLSTISEKQKSAERKKKHADFIVDASSSLIVLTQIAQADSTNQKAIDYLLCGVLLGKDLKGFYKLFQQYYHTQDGKEIPVHYQEALLLTDMMQPQLNIRLQYPITPEYIDAFEDFGVLLAQRPNADHLLKQKYGNTYWYYGFVRNQ